MVEMKTLVIGESLTSKANLLKEVVLEVREVVQSDDVGTAMGAKLAVEDGLHCWRSLPVWHGICHL